MQIYHYHPDSKELLGASLADESPLQPGIYLIPAYATDKQPLPMQDGKKVVYSNNEWQYQDIPQEPEKPPKDKEELQAEALAGLDAVYEQSFRIKQQAWAAANLDGNQARIDQLKAEYTALKAEYEKNREKIMLR